MEYTRKDVLEKGLKLAGSMFLGITLESMLRKKPLEKKQVKLPKKNYKTKNFYKDSDEVLLARMIFGEARWEPEKEKIAVAYTALNRAFDGENWNGKNLKEAILKPKQYSCFNYNTKDRWILKDPMRHYPKQFEKCLILAKEILNGDHIDPTKGSTFYYNPKGVRRTPRWTRKLKKIGRIKVGNGKKSAHVFYKEFDAKRYFDKWIISQLRIKK